MSGHKTLIPSSLIRLSMDNHSEVKKKMNKRMEKFEKTKSEVKEYIKTLDMPFSIQDIAKKFDISWNTAKAILLELALEGEVKATKTTKSYVFTVKENGGKESR